jgi:energy-coupling factor transporter ATP-binding protein EcfA2
MSRAVSIEDLTYAYRSQETPALRHIQNEIQEGSLVVALGHSGAGKSTLCTSLNGIVPHFFRGRYQGRVFIQGLEVARHKVAEMSRHVGLVLQDFEPQLFSTNVELEMAFGPENLRLPRGEIQRRIETYLPFLGLEHLRRREPASLSGGQKQRLAISSVLTMEPKMLVMDEPTTDLDPRGREEVLSIARRLQEERRTLLIVDSDPETAVRADQVWLMREGRIAAQGAPGEILSDIPGLQACGVKVPGLIELFVEMGWPGRPLDVNEAVSLIEKHNLARKGKLHPPEPPGSGLKGSCILRVEDLVYAYPGYASEALRGINLEIREGEFVALIGQNGSGKTTLAKQFNGLLKPKAGRVLLKGRATTEYKQQQVSRLVGYVFQNPDHQIFCNTVYDEVAFGLKTLGESLPSLDRRVAEALDTVGLIEYEKKVPFALSKGERQRVAVASVLAVHPEILILDEPTTGLDEKQQRALMEMLRSLNGRGHTILIITHSMEVAAEYARRAIVMKDGRVLLDGPTRWAFAQEDRLKEAALHPSPLARLGNRLGTRALTVKQMAEELKG